MSPAALQRVADVMGRKLHPSTEPEASLRGAAIRALEKIDIDAEAEGGGRLIASPKPFQPRRKYAAMYARERERQVRLEKLLTAAGRI